MIIAYILHIILLIEASGNPKNEEIIDVIDLSHPTTLSILAEYYGAVEKRWHAKPLISAAICTSRYVNNSFGGTKICDTIIPTGVGRATSHQNCNLQSHWVLKKICMNCGIAGLGTAMHLEHEVSSSNSMYPAVIPTEYLITRLAVIDVSALVKLNSNLVLSLEVALQWPVLRVDPKEPTLLLFKFGLKPNVGKKVRTCVCKIPGISFELAEWIAGNLTHVVGVATDTPTLESEQTREFNTQTVANILGKSGVYMIENVNIRRTLPERGCMAIAMPLKLQHASYVPSRLTAFCPAHNLGHQVVLSLSFTESSKLFHSRNNDVEMDDIMY